MGVKQEVEHILFFPYFKGYFQYGGASFTSFQSKDRGGVWIAPPFLHPLQSLSFRAVSLQLPTGFNVESRAVALITFGQRRIVMPLSVSQWSIGLLTVTVALLV